MRPSLALPCVVVVALFGAALSCRAPGPAGASPSPAAKSSPPAGSSSASRPNVIIYLVDTLRADHLGLYGYRNDTSPTLDRWATEGVVFERAYAPCSWTKPSVVSLLSGLDPARHGVEDRLDVIPDHVRLLSERLKASGYSTFAAVTNPNVLPHWGFGRGFDVYEDLDSAGHGTRADAVSDFVDRTIDDLAGKQPFFMYLHVLDPHGPYDPPAPFDTRFPRLPAFPAELSIASYDGEIAFVDSQFARILASLKAQGLDDDTLTIFVADHGEEQLDHGSFGHGGTLFEEVVRVPLVMRFPKGLHAGRRVSARASLADVVPTVLSVAGQPPPSDLDGHDLTELLTGDEPHWANRDLYLSLNTTGPHGHLVRGVVSGSHAYLRRSRPDASESLFDIERDPAETEDLATKEPAVLGRLAAMLDAYLARQSRGVHLRLVNDANGDPVRCEAELQASGRFVDVSAVRLESDDRFELSDDGRSLRLVSQLENRVQATTQGARLVPDEDGLIFLVTPPDATIVVQHVRLAGGEALPLRAGAGRRLEATPFSFGATDAALSVRDAAEMLGDASSLPERGATGAYVGVVREPEKPEEPSAELLERLRSLGYVGH